MNENLLAMLRKLPLDRQTMAAALPLVSRFGLAGLLVLARGYLGPLAYRGKPGDPCAPRCPDPAGKPPAERPPTDTPPADHPDGDIDGHAGAVAGSPDDSSSGHGSSASSSGNPGTSAPKPGGLSACDAEVLGLALHKLVFELGELALHNPGLDAAGKHPEFTLDDHGRPPAMSVAHVLAAVRFWQQRSAQRDAEAQAREAQAAIAARAPRVQLLAARSERYAVVTRYSYVAPGATFRAPR